MSSRHSDARAETSDVSPLAYFVDLEPPQDDFFQDALDGLMQGQKTLLPKYFYDKAGSVLFDRLCATSEYYVTRVELALLESRRSDIADLAGVGPRVIEYGSGSGRKTRILLNALTDPSDYLAVDISREHLLQAAEAIAVDFPEIRVGAICADFTAPIEVPSDVFVEDDNWLGFFPGSTIGNSDPVAASELLKAYRRFLWPDGHFLIGVDLKKNKDILTAAYNDQDGITAAFNINILHRMRRELGAAVNVDGFEHCAFYNERAGRVEMHLKSNRDQSITLDDHEIFIAKGETIHTENSYKYHVDEFIGLAETAGFRSRAVWTDDQNRFSVHMLTVAP